MGTNKDTFDHKPERRVCTVCGRPYAIEEQLKPEHDDWGPPIDYDAGCDNHCLACWLGVGPTDFPEIYK